MLTKRSLHISWSNFQWNVLGNGVQEKELDDEVIFTKSKILNIRIPLQWKKNEATEECRKYGQAVISKPPSPDMNNVTDKDIVNFYGNNLDPCTFIWTPFTDKYSDGLFVDENTNETIRYFLHITFTFTLIHNVEIFDGIKDNQMVVVSKVTSDSDHSKKLLMI